MNGCPDDEMAAGVIAHRLSAQQQKRFDEMAKRGEHEYVLELEVRLTAVERERDELRGQDEVSKALAELRVATAMDRVEVLCHVNSGFKIAGMRDGNRLIDTGWHDSFEAAMQNVRVWNPMESSK